MKKGSLFIVLTIVVSLFNLYGCSGDIAKHFGGASREESGMVVEIGEDQYAYAYISLRNPNGKIVGIEGIKNFKSYRKAVEEIRDSGKKCRINFEVTRNPFESWDRVEIKKIQIE